MASRDWLSISHGQGDLGQLTQGGGLPFSTTASPSRRNSARAHTTQIQYNNRKLSDDETRFRRTSRIVPRTYLSCHVTVPNAPSPSRQRPNIQHHCAGKLARSASSAVREGSTREGLPMQHACVMSVKSYMYKPKGQRNTSIFQSSRAVFRGAHTTLAIYGVKAANVLDSTHLRKPWRKTPACQYETRLQEAASRWADNQC